MNRFTPPDPVTSAACRWLVAGAVPGGYRGPEPDPGHDLCPLLCREFGRDDLALAGAAGWFRLEQTLRPVLKRVFDLGLQVWAMKGFDLARSVYPFPGGRPMGDADLMTGPGESSAVIGAFLRNGWTPGSPGDGVYSSGIVSEMKMYRHSVLAELHTHIFYFPATFPGKLPSDLYRGGRTLEPGLAGFAWHNALLVVLLHILTNREILPRWWADASLLCVRVTEAGGWDRFTANALGTRLARPMSFLLGTARESFDAPVPERTVSLLSRQGPEGEKMIRLMGSRRKMPTLVNLIRLRGWRRVSWLNALFWLVLTGQRPVSRGKG